VDAAFSMGLLKGPGLRTVVLSIESWIMRRFHTVSTISSRMLERAAGKRVPAANLFPFPNWVDITHINPLSSPSSYREELGIPTDAVVALYSGNMGAKQGLETLAAIAHELRADTNITFVFCGDGAGKADLGLRCAGLKNVLLLPLQPKARLNELMGLADIHLLPQRADAADLVLPSKLTGMLASGRSIIVTADPDTELGQVIRKSGAGVTVPPEDPVRFACAIRDLASAPERRALMGAAGRQYAERELNIDMVLRRFEARLISSLI
jgi:colanic acid biosynthesis glycosyl transferase WcaI